MKGFEPSTFAMARRRSSQLSYIRERSGHSNRSKIGASLERVGNGRAERALSRALASRLAAGGLAFEGGASEVPERLVPSAHGLAEASFGGVLLEGVSLARVAGDAIEHRAQQLRGV